MIESTHILIKIRKIVRSINLESKKIQKEYGISITQLLCLNYLSECADYHSTQHDIRHYLNLNSSTVTGIIQRLEKKGFVAKLPKTGDKRVTHIILTSKGEKLRSQVPPLLHDKLASKLGELSSNKIQEITESLDVLIHLLNIEKLDASPLLTSEDHINDQE